MRTLLQKVMKHGTFLFRQFFENVLVSLTCIEHENRFR